MKKSNEHGVSAVEFALLLPVLVLILFGIIEFGLILYDKAVITNASREVARAGITQGANITTITTDVVNKYKDNLFSFGSDKLQTDDINVKIDVDNDGNFLAGACADYAIGGNVTEIFGKPLMANVTYQYNFLVLDFFGMTLNPLTASTTMRCE